MKREPRVKLLICYHKPDTLLQDEILTPIHVGRAIARKKGSPTLEWMEAHMIGDDTGENLSLQNGAYNELTATYWAWKNYGALGDPDYVGLMHYRRHFFFDPARDLGFVERDGMGEEYLDFLSYSPRRVRELVEGQDIVYYRGRVSEIYGHYRENHKIEDFDLALRILEELHPEDSAVARAFVKGDTGCFCNMAIFSKEVFFAYCEWLFPILEEFARRVDMTEKRFFISERLTGIFVAKMEAEGKRTRPLASCFVRTEYRIPVVMPFEASRTFELAVTIQSLLTHAKPTTHLDFIFLSNGEIGEWETRLSSLLSARADFSMRTVDLKKFCEQYGAERLLLHPALYPLLIAEAVEELGKCFYLTPDVIVTRDIEEFFRLCSVDDFWIVGDGRKTEGAIEWQGGSCVIQCERMRAHGVLKKLLASEANEVREALLATCEGEYSVYPTWFWYLAGETEGEREAVCAEVMRHPLLCYQADARPMQTGPSSHEAILWWELASTLPREWKDGEWIRMQISSLPRPSLVTRVLRYCRRYGIRSTLRRFWQKILRK